VQHKDATRISSQLICTGGGLPYGIESAQIIDMAHPFFESAQIIAAVALLISAIGSAVSKVILALRWGRGAQTGRLQQMVAGTVAKSLRSQKNDNKTG
jgi:hypothetical protein